MDHFKAFEGISGRKVYIKPLDIVLIEEIEVNQLPSCIVVTRHGVKTTLQMKADEILGIIDKDRFDDKEFWQERLKKGERIKNALEASKED